MGKVTVNHTLQFAEKYALRLKYMYYEMAEVTGVKLYKPWTIAQSHKLGIMKQR